MTRLAQPRATRGSQRWLQEFVAGSDPRLERPLLEALGASAIEWVSPLPADDFAEYCDRSFLDRIGVAAQIGLSTYWPRRGPVWDGLAITDRGTRVLIEAKSHHNEMTSSMAASSPTSRALIERTLSETADELGTGITPAWTGGLYQYANRLAHLRYLRHLNGIDAVLAFVYFVGDRDMGGPQTSDDWRTVIGAAKASLGLSDHVDGVIEVMVPVA